MLFYQIVYQSRACKRDWRCNFMMFIRRGDIISCCYVIECHRYYDKVGTILTANLIKKLIEIQYAVYSDIIPNCISQNRYEIKCTCRSLSLRTVWYAYNLYHLLFQESLQFPKFTQQLNDISEDLLVLHVDTCKLVELVYNTRTGVPIF